MQDASPELDSTSRTNPKTPSLSIQLPSSPPLTDPGEAGTETMAHRSSTSRSTAYPTPLHSASPADRPSHRYSASLELRKLFDDEPEEHEPVTRERGSSVGNVLQPAFEQGTAQQGTKTRSRVLTRSAAGFDLARWLQDNFKHTAPPHTNVTPSQSLLSLHSLLLQHLPASCVPSREALPLAVLGAFPAAKWEWPATSGDPPLIRGLVWNAIDDEGSHSPDGIHGTPARSVLDEFAELAAMSEKTPVRLARSQSRKRKASKSPEPSVAAAPQRAAKGKGRAATSRSRRATTPDGLHGLLAAAAHVEGSPMASASKRRRTVNGQDQPKSAISPIRKSRALSAADDALGLSTMPEEPNAPGSDDESASNTIPLALAAIGVDPVSAGIPVTRAGPSSVAGSVASHISSVSRAVEPAAASTSTAPAAAVSLTKPPHPYHEMIRYAIESAPGQKLQLAQIYKSIADRFPFFKMLDEQKTAGWQNSIRHNLSLKKMFVRTTKPEGYDEDITGKGGWWTVQPGVPDEGRPGRKAKAKKLKLEAAAAAAASTSPAPAPAPAPMPPQNQHPLQMPQGYEHGYYPYHGPHYTQ